MSQDVSHDLVEVLVRELDFGRNLNSHRTFNHDVELFSLLTVVADYLFFLEEFQLDAFVDPEQVKLPLLLEKILEELVVSQEELVQERQVGVRS